MGIFERYLSIWVGICIVTGVVLGKLAPNAFELLAKLEFAHVNLVVAVLIWAMIYPMMVKIDFSSVKEVRERPRGLILTLTVNWLIKPFTMALLAWLFFRVIYAGLFEPAVAGEYIAGMILLGVAPCTAMVFVWSQLTHGDPNYTLVQVSLNDIIMIFAFAPIAALLLGVSEIHVPWSTLILSVILYVMLPLAFGVLSRHLLGSAKGNDEGGDEDPHRIENFVNRLKPWSIVSLLATVTLLFGFQADKIFSQPQTIILLAIPLILQSYGIFAIAYWLAHVMKLQQNIAAPACLIATSNFFELAVAVAISLFGLHSGAALATVVGVLVEVPVMLSLVAFVNRTRHWFN